MPFQRCREMRNAHAAGKTESPRTMAVAGPAKAQPVAGRATRRRTREDHARLPAGAAASPEAGLPVVAPVAMSAPHDASASSDCLAARSSASFGLAAPWSTLAIASPTLRDI